MFSFFIHNNVFSRSKSSYVDVPNPHGLGKTHKVVLHFCGNTHKREHWYILEPPISLLLRVHVLSYTYIAWSNPLPFQSEGKARGSGQNLEILSAHRPIKLHQKKVPVGLPHHHFFSPVPQMKRKASRSSASSLDTMMEKWVLVFYCNPTKWPEPFMVEATPKEIQLLKEVNNVAEGSAWEHSGMRATHIAILHYLGKASLYKNEEEFNREKKGWRDDDEWDQEELDLVMWSNHGKWARPENLAGNGECMGAWYFYHIHVDA
jgi:hypothetical protein